MIKVRSKDFVRLDQRKNALKQTAPLMRSIASARRKDFDRRFEAELDPEDRPLRDLTDQYQQWKNRHHPGKKKREITGKTRESHKITITDKALKEEVGGNAVWLQYFLDLPLLPFNPAVDMEEIRQLALDFAVKAMRGE